MTNGYPMFWFQRRAQRAVRVAWIGAGKKLHPSDRITQQCRNSRCVNPAHLEPISRPRQAFRARMIQRETRKRRRLERHSPCTKFELAST